MVIIIIIIIIMVGEEAELTAFQQKTKMPDGGESRQQLPVERGVPGFRRRQLVREKGQRPPSTAL